MKLHCSKVETHKDCPHCNSDSFALKQLLAKSDHFRIVVDANPLTEGHVLVIPNRHYAAVGAFPKDIFQEFVEMYEKASVFIQKQYGSVATFEHGVIGQTVFHSHVHVLPFTGSILDIIPEGNTYCTPIKNISDLLTIYKKDKKYLFISIGKNMWVIDTVLGRPRFFRDRFAQALGVAERGNWKNMHEDMSIMNKVDAEIYATKKKWKAMMSEKTL